MNIPSLPGIVDLVALQNAVAMILMADDRLGTVPIIPEFKLHMESDIMVDILWTAPRSAFRVLSGSIAVEPGVSDTVQGPVGAGLLIEMPVAKCNSPNVTGPPLTWEINVIAFEERNVNLTPSVGIGILSEQLAQLVLDVLQLQAIWSGSGGFGTLRAAPTPLGPDHYWMNLKPGITAWKTTMSTTLGRAQTARSANVAFTFGGGNVTLTCPEPGCEIRYTVNGSTPVKINPDSIIYTAPFPITSGQLMLTSSWVPGKLISAVAGGIAP